MKISSIQVHQIQIPLNVKFAQSNNTTWHSNSMIFEVATEQGTVGYGESCPRTYVTGEDPESVRIDLENIKPDILTIEWTSLLQLQEYVCKDLPGKIGLATICGLELALMDAWGKESSTSIFEKLGAIAPESWPYSGVIPMVAIDKFPKLMERIRLFSFSELKLKIGRDLGDSLAKISLIRGFFCERTTIRLDANCSWEIEDAWEQIPVFLEHGITTFEQIFLPELDKSMKAITARFGDRARLMADESITSFESATKLIQHQLFNHFNLKISKHGGILHTYNIYKLIQSHGLTCQLGAHFGETSLLTAAGMIFSGLAPDLQAREGALGQYLLKQDICANSISIDLQGNLIPSNEWTSAKGLGVAVQRDRIISFDKVNLR